MKNVLIAEDEIIVARDMEDMVRAAGYAVCGIAASGEEALSLARACPPDLLLMDISLAGPMDGIEAAGIIRREHFCPVIFVTAFADNDTVLRAKQVEPAAYLRKPFDRRDIEVALEIAFHRHAMEKKVKASEAWLSCTMACIGDGIVACDRSEELCYVNDAACAMTGRPRQELLEIPLDRALILIDELSQRGETALYARTMAAGRPLYFENHLLHTAAGSRLPVTVSVAPIVDQGGSTHGVVAVLTDLSQARQAEQERERLLAEREHALSEVMTLSGLLPICASCKNIRDDKGYWMRIEEYITTHTGIDFSHGLCPSSASRLYPDMFPRVKR